MKSVLIGFFLSYSKFAHFLECAAVKMNLHIGTLLASSIPIVGFILFTIRLAVLVIEVLSFFFGSDIEGLTPAVQMILAQKGQMMHQWVTLSATSNLDKRERSDDVISLLKEKSENKSPIYW